MSVLAFFGPRFWQFLFTFHLFRPIAVAAAEISSTGKRLLYFTADFS